MDSIDHWAELFVREMLRASTVEDGKARASRLLENFKKSIWELSTAGINEVFEHGDALFHENTKLKQAVAIQHELQKEYEKQKLELQQLVSQYQIGLRNLQAKNFALTRQNQQMKNFLTSSHLQQTQQSNSIPRRFPTP
ncbi:uncharacterized protein LOC115954268 [Quercus lobata]|uniref:Uncharacterized protein n=1 Tax=Quercus lobata TaxID=97700 RepID=A0A7N2M7G2_QUELO|nr:uncharacterized protein LOC115954268 [Quercus lobata]